MKKVLVQVGNSSIFISLQRLHFANSVSYLIWPQILFQHLWLFLPICVADGEIVRTELTQVIFYCMQ